MCTICFDVLNQKVLFLHRVDADEIHAMRLAKLAGLAPTLGVADTKVVVFAPEPFDSTWWQVVAQDEPAARIAAR